MSSVELCGVIRHCERADSLDALIDGVHWHGTQDCADFPTDPPLSDAGQVDARRVAERVADFSRQTKTQVHAIVSSPYLRCIQTALAICKAVGPDVQLVIDDSLGEIYGPKVMGDNPPLHAIRPLAKTIEDCRKEGVRCFADTLGSWPSWPEGIHHARRRYMDRFLTYRHWSIVTNRNCLLVSHAVCCDVALSGMLSDVGHSVSSVGHGGMFLAARALQESAPATLKLSNVPLLPIDKFSPTSMSTGSTSCSSASSSPREESDLTSLASFSRAASVSRSPRTSSKASSSSALFSSRTYAGGCTSTTIDSLSGSMFSFPVEDGPVVESVEPDDTKDVALCTNPRQISCPMCLADGWKVQLDNVELSNAPKCHSTNVIAWSTKCRDLRDDAVPQQQDVASSNFQPRMRSGIFEPRVPSLLPQGHVPAWLLRIFGIESPGTPKGESQIGCQCRQCVESEFRDWIDWAGHGGRGGSTARDRRPSSLSICGDAGPGNRTLTIDCLLDYTADEACRPSSRRCSRECASTMGSMRPPSLDDAGDDELPGTALESRQLSSSSTPACDRNPGERQSTPDVKKSVIFKGLEHSALLHRRNNTSLSSARSSCSDSPADRRRLSTTNGSKSLPLDMRLFRRSPAGSSKSPSGTCEGS